MPTREISSTDWAEFCKRFSRDQRGRLLSVEMLDPSGTHNRIADRLPLQEMVFENTDQCNDHVYLLLGEPHEVTHTIIEPIHLKIQNHDGSRVLRIDAENGTTLVYFETDTLSEILKDLTLA